MNKRAHKIELAVDNDDGWKPRRRGNAYCSPRCGFNCSLASYERAVKEAAQLAARMGKGWEPVVWENCGWHWSAVKGVCTITPSYTGSKLGGNYVVTGFNCAFNTEKQFFTDAKEPEDALGFAVQMARASSRKIADDLNLLLDEDN